MEDFFGFIDCQPTTKKRHSHMNFNKYISYQESHNDYHLCLRHAHNNAFKSLNNKDFTILIHGDFSNTSTICSHLNIQNLQINALDIIKELYKKHPDNFINYIEGQFSLFLFDKNKKSIFIFKDITGLYPLNYHFKDKLLVFGTHVSHFHLAPRFQTTISQQGLASYLQFGYILQPLTIFQNCYKVQSGEGISFDLLKQSYKKKTYNKLENFYQERKNSIGEQEFIVGAKELLIQSITESTQKNSKSAVSLSGGYDSSSIVALLQAQSEKPIDTFTIGFEEKDINEAPYAKKIAQHLGTNHHEHYFSDTDAENIVPKLCQIYDEPFSDYAATPTVMTTELLKANNIDQLLVGDGGDEVFATADDVAFFERIQSLPYRVRKHMLSPLLKINMSKLPYLNDWNNLPSKCQKLLRIFSAPNIPQMVKIRNLLFREDELKVMIQNYNTAPISSFDNIEFSGQEESVDEIIGSYFKTTMIDGELVKSKGATAYNNIDLKTPYLNEELIRYMAKVPASIKIKDGIKKHLLKEIVHEYIPKKLLDRPKSGFDIPFASWMKNGLKALLYEQINEKRLKEDNLFYPSSILLIRDKFYAGHESYKYKLWRIFLFQLWYDNYNNKNKG